MLVSIDKLHRKGSSAQVHALVRQQPELARALAYELLFDHVDDANSDDSHPWVPNPLAVADSIIGALPEPGVAPSDRKAAQQLKKGGAPPSGQRSPFVQAAWAYLELSALDPKKKGQLPVFRAKAHEVLKACERAQLLTCRLYTEGAMASANLENDGKSKAARATAERALELSRDLRHTYYYSAMLTTRGFSQFENGDAKSGAESFAEAVRIRRDNKWNRGKVYRGALESAFFLAQKSGSSTLVAEFGPELGRLLLEDKNTEGARNVFEQTAGAALQLLRKRGHDHRRPTERARLLKIFTEAARHTAQLYLDSGDHWQAANIRTVIADETMERGSPDIAAQEAAIALDLLAKVKPSPKRTQLELRASMLRGRGLPGKAGSKVLVAAANRALKAGLKDQAIRLLVYAGDKSFGGGNAYLRAVEIGEKSNHPRLLAMALDRLANSKKSGASYEKHMKRAIEVATAKLNLRTQATYRLRYGNALVDHGKVRKGIRYLEESITWANKNMLLNELDFVLAVARAHGKSGGAKAHAKQIAYLLRWESTWKKRVPFRIRILRELASLYSDGPVLDLPAAERTLRTVLDSMEARGTKADKITNLILNDLFLVMVRRDAVEKLKGAGVTLYADDPQAFRKIVPFLDPSRFSLRDQLRLLQRAEKIAKKQNDSDSLSRLLIAKASLFERAGRADEAMRTCQEGLALASLVPSSGAWPNPTREDVILPHQATRAIECKGRLLRNAGRSTLDPARRAELFDRAIDNYSLARKVASDSTFRLTSSAGFVLSAFVAFDKEAYVALLIEAGKKEAALESLEALRSDELRDLVEVKAEELGDATAGKQVARARTLEKQEKKTLKELREIATDPKQTARRKKLKKQLAESRKQFVSALQEIENKHPEYASLVKFRSLDLAGVQKKLPQDAVLIEYFPSESVLYLFVVTREHFAVERAAVGRNQLAKLVRSFRSWVQEQPDSPTGWADPNSDPDDSLTGASAELYRYLVAPAKPHLAGAKQVLLVPTDSLTYLPFAALGRRKNGSFRFWIQDVRLGTLPAIKSLHSTGPRSGPGAQNKPGRLLAIGNPDGSLPSAAAEVRSVASLFQDARVQTNKPVVQQWFEDQAENSGVIHLATHAILNASDPLASYVLMGKSKNKGARLTVRDIYGLVLNGSPLVTLSACNTAIGDKNPGAEIASLAQAFGIAGAPTIIASLWEVPDVATRDLMTGFYSGIRDGLGASRALASAQRKLLSRPDTSHPYFWAAFSVIGRPGQ